MGEGEGRKTKKKRGQTKRRMMCALRRFIWPISSSAAANSRGNVDAFIWKADGRGGDPNKKD